MLTVEALRAFGADIEDGLMRCMNNETMYLRLVDMALHDANFDRLVSSLKAEDKKTAFEAVHAIKGVTANLSLTPLYETASEMTELLRTGADADYEGLLERLLQCRDEVLNR